MFPAYTPLISKLMGELQDSNQLPNIVLKKIYDCCSNETKKNLTLAFDGCGRKTILQDAGCYREKPRLFCFVCQFEMFFKEFVEDDCDRGTLGLHFLYFLSHIGRIQEDEELDRWVTEIKYSLREGKDDIGEPLPENQGWQLFGYFGEKKNDMYSTFIYFTLTDICPSLGRGVPQKQI